MDRLSIKKKKSQSFVWQTRVQRAPKVFPVPVPAVSDIWMLIVHPQWMWKASLQDWSQNLIQSPNRRSLWHQQAVFIDLHTGQLIRHECEGWFICQIVNEFHVTKSPFSKYQIASQIATRVAYICSRSVLLYVSVKKDIDRSCSHTHSEDLAPHSIKKQCHTRGSFRLVVTWALKDASLPNLAQAKKIGPRSGVEIGG